ncbi:MAG: GAF domain-containing protein [Desulfobacterales bacterium]
MDEMVKKVLRKIKNVFQIEGASIALHDPDDRTFYFIRTVEEQQNGMHEEKERMRFPDNYGVAGWVLRENKPVFIPDVTTDKRFKNELDIQQDFPTRPMICVPLKTRSGVIGVIYALNKLKGGEFSPKEVRLLEILSGTIAVSIEGVRFCGEIKQYADSLENEIERALTLAGDDREIKVEYVSERMKVSGRHVSPANQTQVTLRKATEQLERQMVAVALDKSDGNRSQAARILGLTRQGLLNKIARYNIKM